MLLRFVPAVAPRVAETTWHPTQVVEREADGSLAWRATVSGTIEIRSWILSWGPDVEVLAPAALRAEVADLVARAAASIADAGPPPCIADAGPPLRIADARPFPAGGERPQWAHAPGPLRRRQPHQRPDPRLHRADEAARPRRGARRRPAGGGRRRGGHPRHGLAPAAAADQPAPERALGLPDGRALALHPRPGRHARGRAVGAPALPVARRGARRRPTPGCGRPSEGLVVETLRVAGPPPRRRPRPVRPLLRRARPGGLPGARRRPAARRRKAADPRGPLAADHRARAGTAHPAACAAPPATGSRPATRSPTARRSTRPGSPSWSSKPPLDDPAMPALGPLAPAAPVGRLHGRQPGLRPARRLPDGRLGGAGRRRAAPPLRLHLRAGAHALRARARAPSRCS